MGYGGTAASFDRSPSSSWPGVQTDSFRRERESRRRRRLNAIVIACSSAVVITAISVCYALLSQ
jgi:hypothetical protein